MISVLSPSMIAIMQERLVGAALGAAFVSFIVFEQRKCIYESIPANIVRLDIQSQLRESVFGKEVRSQFKFLWNEALDEAFRPFVTSLSSRKL